VSELSEPERSRAIVRLRDRYATDKLSLDEFSRALDGVLCATNREDVERASPDVGISPPASRGPWLDAGRLTDFLSPDEEILWVGRPDPRPRGFGVPIGRVPFLILWFGFAIFWETTVIATDAPVFFPIFGAGFLLVGLAQVRSQLFSARRALYAITTTHVIRVMDQRAGPRVDTALIRAIPNVSVTPTKRGHGTVTFGRIAPPASRYASVGFGTRTSAYQPDDAVEFLDIPEANAVARLVGSLQSHDAA